MNIIKKLIKYFVLLIILFISIIFITKSKVDNFDSFAIALIGVASYALADQYAPSYIIEEKH
jgi:nicotinamide riboside transporter PnuC